MGGTIRDGQFGKNELSSESKKLFGERGLFWFNCTVVNFKEKIEPFYLFSWQHRFTPNKLTYDQKLIALLYPPFFVTFRDEQK